MAGVLLLAGPAHAGIDIDIDQQRHEEQESYRGDFRFNRSNNADFAVRMGIATSGPGRAQAACISGCAG